MKEDRENKIVQNNNKQPTLIYFPQWQGAGLSNNVQIGAETLCRFFYDIVPVIVPLSDKALNTYHNIIGYEPLVAQLISAQEILNQKQPDRLVLIAGDCAAEIAPVAYLNKRYNGRLTIIWLDAHGDLNNPDSSPSGHFHGMPLRLLLDGEFAGISVDKPVKSGQVILVGVRDLDVAEKVYISENSIAVLDGDGNWKKKLLDLLVQQNAENIYIHLDLDILDPLLFPYLQCPTPNGLLPEDIADFIKQIIKNYNVTGLSLTETTAEKQADLQPIASVLNVYKEYLINATSI